MNNILIENSAKNFRVFTASINTVLIFKYFFSFMKVWIVDRCMMTVIWPVSNFGFWTSDGFY